MHVEIKNAGLGFRFKYAEALQQNPCKIEWLELLVDHFHDFNAPNIQKIAPLIDQFPCVLHAVNLSLASRDSLKEAYLKTVQKIVDRFNPAWISDHLCFSHVGEIFFHDLLPVPFTKALLDRVAFKIETLQQRFKRPFLIENISSYLRLSGNQMTEAEFLRDLSRMTGCGILLDVNNIVVTCHNHQESITEYCETIPFQAVKQIHLAGATPQNDLLIDTHCQRIAEPVWQLYKTIITEQGAIPTCLEWDNDLPDYAVICEEIEKISNCVEKTAAPVLARQQPEVLNRVALSESVELHETAFLQALQGSSALLQTLVSAPDFESRFKIYEISIRTTLQKTLLKTFKPLQHLLGVEAFEELCLHYAYHAFSTELNLNHYGEKLCEFVNEAPYAKEMPYLPDFINFCYQWQQIYLNPELGSVTIISNYPVYEIWQRCQPEFQGEKTLAEWHGPFTYVLSHQGGRVQVKALAVS